MKNLIELKYAPFDEVSDFFSKNTCNMDAEDEDGATALIAAIASGRSDIVELLLKIGADPNYNSQEATLPLIFSIDSAIEADDYQGEVALNKYLDIIRLLIKYGASPKKDDIIERVNALEYSKGRLPEAQDIFEDNL